jgi:pilus assembly protein Flp/PilA
MFRNEDGATTIEYGLIASLIAVVILGAVSAFGTDLGNGFLKIRTETDVTSFVGGERPDGGGGFEGGPDGEGRRPPGGFFGID